MTLRRKTVTLVALTLAGLLAVMTLVTRELLGRGFLQLEQDQARRDLQRALNALDDDLAQLGSTVEDYAAWDRMVDFAEGRGQALLASEFVPLTLQNLRLHGIVILDGRRRPLFTYGLDPDTGLAAPAPPELLDELRRADAVLLGHTDVSGNLTGVLPATRWPLLVASHPIVTSEGLGPIRGTVVFARYLTAAAERKLADVTRLSVRIRAVSERAAPPDIASALAELAAGARDLVRPLGDQRVASYATVPSLHGRPALVVRVDSPRSVVQQGRLTLRYLVVVLLTAGLAFTTLMIGVLEWSVLSPLSRLRRSVDGVTASGDLALRMPTAGPDEFAVLAGTMNTMLAALERSDRDLRSAREAALQASRAKSDLLANVSHEIRTPMNGVLGMAELLARTPLTQQQRRYLETVRGSADGLIQILNDVLDLSKMEAGRFSLSLAPTDIASVVQQAVDVFGGRAQAKGIDLSLCCEPGVPNLVAADAVRVRQIVLNLVGNAVKFTDRGFVRVDLAAAPVAGRDDAALLTIAVRDTGCGIEADHIDRVFDKFAQAEGARHHGGTGLGLTISRQLAVLMGGDIRVESAVGVGTTFSLVFAAPVVSAAAGSSLSNSSPAGREPGAGGVKSVLKGARVLVAEDHLVNQEVTRLMLEDMGCSVVVVGDGEAAVSKAREGTYDAVLMDCRMPRLDGRRAASAIRALGGRWNTVPIIAVTADVLDGEGERCLQAGMDGVLTKPLRWDDLRAALEARVGGSPATDPALAQGGAGAPAPAACDGEMDWKVLADLERLRRPNGPDPVAHVVMLFIEDGPARLSEMERAIADKEPGVLGEAAHALKGSSGTVGAVRLRSLCAAIETGARGGSLEEAGELCREARETFSRTRLALRRRLLEDNRETASGPAVG